MVRIKISVLCKMAKYAVKYNNNAARENTSQPQCIIWYFHEKVVVLTIFFHHFSNIIHQKKETIAEAATRRSPARSRISSLRNPITYVALVYLRNPIVWHLVQESCMKHLRCLGRAQRDSKYPRRRTASKSS